MDVQIEQLNSTVEVADGESMLRPETLRRIVAAVKAELARDALSQRSHTQDLDTRSIVEQQREGGR